VSVNCRHWSRRWNLIGLNTCIRWEYLPQQLGFCSGMNYRRCLAAWNKKEAAAGTAAGRP
jgi:hypothetical protein